LNDRFRERRLVDEKEPPGITGHRHLDRDCVALYCPAIPNVTLPESYHMQELLDSKESRSVPVPSVTAQRTSWL